MSSSLQHPGVIPPLKKETSTCRDNVTNAAHHGHPHNGHPTSSTSSSQLAIQPDFDMFRRYPPPILRLYCPTFSFGLEGFTTHVLNGFWIGSRPEAHIALTAYANACALMGPESRPPAYSHTIPVSHAIIAYASSRCFVESFPEADVGTFDSIKFAPMWEGLDPKRREDVFRLAFVEWCCAWLSINSADVGDVCLASTNNGDGPKPGFSVYGFLLRNFDVDIPSKPSLQNIRTDRVAFLQSTKHPLYRELGLSDDDWVQLVLSRIGGALGLEIYLKLTRERPLKSRQPRPPTT